MSNSVKSEFVWQMPKICFAFPMYARHWLSVIQVMLKEDYLEGGGDTIETPIKNQFGTVVAQKMIYIDEPNLYRCIFQSRKAEAEQFQNWVFEEVLPSIRRNGAYLTDDALARFAEDPDYGIKLLNTLKRERTERLALMKENVTLSLENERMKPLAG